MFWIVGVLPALRELRVFLRQYDVALRIHPISDFESDPIEIVLNVCFVNPAHFLLGTENVNSAYLVETRISLRYRYF